MGDLSPQYSTKSLRLRKFLCSWLQLKFKGIVYIFIKADNTAAALYILNIVLKHYNELHSISQTIVLPEKLTVAQLLIQFLVFYRTHRFTTIFTPVWLTPPHLIPSAHLPSVLTYILHGTTSLMRLIGSVHFKYHAGASKCGTKKVRQTNNRTPNVMFRSYIGTSNIQWTSNPRPHQLYPKLHILNSNNQTKNLVEDNKPS